VLMDEVGRGTSTFDGLALAGAIAAHLHDRNRSFTLFATHYFELTALPEKLPHALNVHVSATESGEDIVFLHDIEPGPASRSYGVQVARLAGMPAAVVRHARSALEGLEARQREGQAQADLFALGDRPPAHEALESIATLGAAADAGTLPEWAAELQAIDPDTLSPRAALELIYRLRARLPSPP
jgi:DNA mismatch repair protein MutS